MRRLAAPEIVHASSTAAPSSCRQGCVAQRNPGVMEFAELPSGGQRRCAAEENSSVISS
jgi:hypothetical protein